MRLPSHPWEADAATGESEKVVVLVLQIAARLDEQNLYGM